MINIYYRMMVFICHHILIGIWTKYMDSLVKSNTSSMTGLWRSLLRLAINFIVLLWLFHRLLYMEHKIYYPCKFYTKAFQQSPFISSHRGQSFRGAWYAVIISYLYLYCWNSELYSIPTEFVFLTLLYVCLYVGGISTQDGGTSLAQIEAITRNREPPESGLMSDLLWAGGYNYDDIWYIAI